MRSERSPVLKNSLIAAGFVGTAIGIAGTGAGIKSGDPLGLYYMLTVPGNTTSSECPTIEPEGIKRATDRLMQPNAVDDGAKLLIPSEQQLGEIASKSKYNFHLGPEAQDRYEIEHASTPEQVEKEIEEMGAAHGYTIHFENNSSQDVETTKRDGLAINAALSAVPIEVTKALGAKDLYLGAQVGALEGEGTDAAAYFKKELNGNKKIILGPGEAETSFTHEMMHDVHTLRCEDENAGNDSQMAAYNTVPYKKRMPNEDTSIDYSREVMGGTRHGLSTAKEDFAMTMEYFAASYPPKEVCKPNATPAYQKAGYGIASLNRFAELAGISAYGDYVLDYRAAVCGTYE